MLNCLVALRGPSPAVEMLAVPGRGRGGGVPLPCTPPSPCTPPGMSGNVWLEHLPHPADPAQVLNPGAASRDEGEKQPT